MLCVDITRDQCTRWNAGAAERLVLSFDAYILCLKQKHCMDAQMISEQQQKQQKHRQQQQQQAESTAAATASDSACRHITAGNDG